MFFSLEGPWKIQVLTQLVEKTRISPRLGAFQKDTKAVLRALDSGVRFFARKR